MALSKGGFSETACAILALTTKLAWTQEMPQPLPRSVVRRMLDCGVLKGLVLRDLPDIEEKWLERARLLLGRVSDVAEKMADYRAAGYELLLQGDERWPTALCKLGENEPLFLFIKGNDHLLEKRMISVAGSRRILAQTQAAARKTGQRVAEDGALLVTGGANGVDLEALCGALEAGGCAVIVPAKPAAHLLGINRISDALVCGKVLLICDTLPDEPFSAGKALARNHTIYALGEASLVVASRTEKGGSWRGATDCLRGGWSNVYVWNGLNPDTAGNHALQKLGAGMYSLEEPLRRQLTLRPMQTSLFGEA